MKDNCSDAPRVWKLQDDYLTGEKRSYPMVGATLDVGVLAPQKHGWKNTIFSNFTIIFSGISHPRIALGANHSRQLPIRTTRTKIRTKRTRGHIIL